MFEKNNLTFSKKCNTCIGISWGINAINEKNLVKWTILPIQEDMGQISSSSSPSLNILVAQVGDTLYVEYKPWNWRKKGQNQVEVIQTKYMTQRLFGVPTHAVLPNMYTCSMRVL